MKITAVSMMRNEADVCQRTVQNLWAQGVDEVIVYDNGSDDGTGDLLRDVGAIVLDDKEEAYVQAKKMTRLAHIAGDRGAEWIIPFDADELWCGDPSVRDMIRPTDHYITAVYYDFCCTPEDDEALHPYDRMQYRSGGGEHCKCTFRYAPGVFIVFGNHAAMFDGRYVEPDHSRLWIRHYPYRSYDQFHRKVVHGKQACLLAGDLASWGWGKYEGTPSEFEERWVRNRADLVHDPLPGMVLDQHPLNRYPLG